MSIALHPLSYMEIWELGNTRFRHSYKCDQFYLFINEPCMKFSLVLALLVLVGVVSGQKGGAKGAMRGNRGKVRLVVI